MVLRIFFSTGQVLLYTLSWCSACTSVSESVFLIYPWREMYSTSAYSSAILFSAEKTILFYVILFVELVFFSWEVQLKACISSTIIEESRNFVTAVV